MVRKMKKDLDYIVRIEKAIADKYGDETVANPRKYWDKDKEKEYLQQMKGFYEKIREAETESSREEHRGVMVSKKFSAIESQRSCPVCKTYSFQSKDDMYMTKFNCCFSCYIKYVEGREQRWKQGWRPNNTVDLSKENTI